MKTKHIFLPLVPVVAILCIGALPGSQEPMPSLAPIGGSDIARDPSWKILPKEDVYEVGASKMELSIRNLPASGYRKLTASAAKYYTGAYYSCPPGKTPYLVRAVYRTGNGPGQFRAERSGNDVAIVFGDMPTLPPPSAKFEWSAVVVNLDFTPDSAYTAVSGFQ